MTLLRNQEFAEPLPPHLARSGRLRGFCPVISQDIGAPPAIPKEPRKCYATSDSAWSGESKRRPSPAEPISLCSATFVYSARPPLPEGGDIPRVNLYTCGSAGGLNNCLDRRSPRVEGSTP